MELRKRGARAAVKVEDLDSSEDDRSRRSKSKGKAPDEVEVEDRRKRKRVSRGKKVVKVAEQAESDVEMPEEEIDPVVDVHVDAEVRTKHKALHRATAKNLASYYAHYKPNNDEFFRTATSRRALPDELADDDPDDQSMLMATDTVPLPPKVVSWEPSRRNAEPDNNHAAAATPKPLFSMCLELLCENIDCVESLEGVSDVIRQCVMTRLYKHGKVSFKAAQLFTSGPHICIPDCSKISAPEFLEMFQGCSLHTIQSLDLGFCGRSLTDQFLIDHKFPSLRKLRLRAHHLLSDTGLRALLQFSRILTEVELVDCSEITDQSVEALTNIQRSNLRVLSLEGCNSIRGSITLPYLYSLSGLKSLSLARVGGVTDKLLTELLLNIGATLEDLDISGCKEVTDEGLGAVPVFCSTLTALHLEGLELLTDRTLRELASGCKSLVKIWFDDCHHFSDEELAKFFADCGAALRNVSLRGVRKAGDNAVVAMSKYASESLETLNVSFCRNVTDDGLGFLADSCVNLVELHLFGCTQISEKFVKGHSNRKLQIFGFFSSKRVNS